MTDMLVSGAGAAEFNGIYYEKDIENGKPYYAKGDHKIWWTSQGKWSIDLDTSYGYAGYSSTDNQPTPDLCQAWVAELAIPPAPTVTLYGEPEPQNLTLECASGSYTLSGKAVTLTTDNTPNGSEYTLNCAAGSYTLSGSDVNLSSDAEPPPVVSEVVGTFPIIRLVIDDEPIEFRDLDVLECNVLQEMDPVGASLPASNGTARIFTTDPRFSIFSDGVFYQALSKFMPVSIFISLNDTEEFIGEFYLDIWEMESEHILRFDLIDALGVCANIDYPGSFWETPTPVSEVVENIMGGVAIAYTIDANVANRTVRGWIPPSNVRDALQQLCFAARMTATTDRQTGIRFRGANLPSGSSVASSITNGQKAGDQTVEHLTQVSDIALVSHNYYHPDENTPQTVDEIFNDWLDVGTHTIAFSKPYWKVWGEGTGSAAIVVATEDGRVIVTEDSSDVWNNLTRIAAESETFAFSSNHVSITVEQAGQVVVWGYPWLSADKTHRQTIPTDVSTSVSVDSAMLISQNSAVDILALLTEYYALNYETTVKIFPKHIALGEHYLIDTFREKQILGAAKRLEIDLAGGYLTKATFIGMEHIP